ncbi:dynein regulatory complex subunit 4 [Planococcus citri]|uniref:dynein regulatory complex subunit 4 n=1 Tax=Planococcus citri TaxID=170843 RepID=UPI0031F7C119
MGGVKKKAKTGKNTKGVTNIIDGVSISEMSREQLEPFIIRIQSELEREREERHFFQLERDKIRTFWEIARQQLQEYRSNLRNRDKQLENLEAGHEIELKGYQQKIKYLSHGQHGQLSELKVENMLSMKGVEQDMASRELLLLNQERELKMQITDQRRRHKSELRTLFLEKNAQLSKMRFESERKRRAFEHKYQCYLQQSRDEMRLKNDMSSAKIEQGKNIMVKRLASTHQGICQRADQFFTDIIAQNLALICVLKRHVSKLNEENVQMKNELCDVKRKNSELVTPLKIANRKIIEYQSQLNVGRRDTQKYQTVEKQAKMLREENEKYKIRYQCLANLFEQAVNERDSTIEALTTTRLHSDKGTAYRELIVQRAAAKLKTATQSVQNILLRFCSTAVADTHLQTSPSPLLIPTESHLSRHHQRRHITMTNIRYVNKGSDSTSYENENQKLISLMEELHALGMEQQPIVFGSDAGSTTTA